MAQKQYIKYLYEVEDKSLREISRITGHSFETVRKYAYQTNWSEDNLPDTRPSRHPVLGSFIPTIDGWLEADKKIPKKQRHTAWRIYCRLRDEYGFKGSYEKGKTYYDWRQYAPTLYRKPRAVEHARFFTQMPKLWQEHLICVQGKEKKDALELLGEIVLDGNDSLCDEALEMAYAAGRTDADSLRQCYYMISRKEYHPEPLKVNSSVMFSYDPDISAYDSLIGGDRHE